jgi:hypothetical protein
MADTITLDPQEAAGSLKVVSNNLTTILQALMALGQEYNRVNEETESSPISEALHNAADAINSLGLNMRTSVTTYANTMVKVVNVYVQIEATGGSFVSYSEPDFKATEVRKKVARVLKGRLSTLDNLVSLTNTKLGELESSFSVMDEAITRSEGYWKGDTGDSARSNWRDNILPKKKEAVELMQNVVKVVKAQREKLAEIDRIKL